MVSLFCPWSSSVDRIQIANWIIWARKHGGLVIWMSDGRLSGEAGTAFLTPAGAMIYRPVPEFSELIEDPFVTVPQSDLVWVDFLWAPGQYSFAIPFLKKAGFRRAGWNRRDNSKVHIVDLKRLPNSSPFVKSTPLGKSRDSTLAT